MGADAMSATLPPGFQLDAPAPAAPNAPAAALPPGFRLDAPAEGLPGPRRTWGDVPADMMQNLPVSAQRFYGGVVEAIMDPLETIKNFADLAAGGLRAGFCLPAAGRRRRKPARFARREV